MNILGIIPARYASTRLKGKPLADIHGKPMIRHVYERATQTLKDVVVATDDQRIFDAVKDFGGKVLMTSKDHTTGTGRCLEVYRTYTFENDAEADVVINIQGDEPLLEPGLLKKLSHCFGDDEVEMATLATKVTDAGDFKDHSNVFVVLKENRYALYFSRSAIPHVHKTPMEEWLQHHDFYRHIGIYAYRPKALAKFASMHASSLEKAESLEQNRWLQAGGNICVEITDHAGISVDTPEDLERVRRIMES